MRNVLTVNRQRPVNLDLGTLTFPPMAIASILHRISGIVLFLLLPAMLYFLSLSLRDNASFMHLQVLLGSPFYKCVLWAFCGAWWYHVLAGFRHMLMDCGFGESLDAGKLGAILVIALGVVGVIVLGVWLW